MRVRAHVALAAMFLLSCAAGGGVSLDATSDGSPIRSSSFTDGAWLFTVDREWDRSLVSVQFPSDPLSEAAYRPVTTGATLRVVVTDGADRVAIGEESPLIGKRTRDGEATVTYDLTECTFAGGRFVVWADANGLQAELTIFGSGVPIVQSQRGQLARE
jgi:hypothetical protein